MENYTLCGVKVSSNEALKMVQECLNVFLNNTNYSSYDCKQIKELKFMVGDLKHRIEAERLECIGDVQFVERKGDKNGIPIKQKIVAC